jgi:uncharacterized protein (DUF1778 family)
MAATSKEGARRAAKKPARLGARITDYQKALFERAAALSGRSVTDFVVSTAEEAAVRTVREHEIMLLSTSDSKAFVASLLSPSRPSKRLRRAAERYKDMTSR